MTSRPRILVVDPDIDSLSKIYLNLLHNNYKVEACTNGSEVADRMKKLKPSILIIHSDFFWEIERKLKIPAIVLTSELNGHRIHEQEDLKVLRKPVSKEALIKAVRSLTV